jgi:hypothetical protein
LIREIIFLAEYGEKKVSRYGERLKTAGGGKKDVWNDTSKGRINEDELETADEQTPAQNISKRMKEWGSSYFTFIDKEIPSTNNAAEQVIRAIVIDRKATQGTRSEWGNRLLISCTTVSIPA